MTANGTYANGLLSTAYTSAATASQAVALKAGTYSINGKVNRGGAAVCPKVVAVGGTDGTVYTSDFTKAVISADDSVRDDIDAQSNKFTLTVNQTVTFTLSLVTGDNTTLASGAAHIRFILESDTGLSYPVVGQA